MPAEESLQSRFTPANLHADLAAIPPYPPRDRTSEEWKLWVKKWVIDVGIDSPPLESEGKEFRAWKHSHIERPFRLAHLMQVAGIQVSMYHKCTHGTHAGRSTWQCCCPVCVTGSKAYAEDAKKKLPKEQKRALKGKPILLVNPEELHPDLLDFYKCRAQGTIPSELMDYLRQHAPPNEPEECEQLQFVEEPEIEPEPEMQVMQEPETMPPLPPPTPLDDKEYQINPRKALDFKGMSDGSTVWTMESGITIIVKPPQ
jgi:hypothetical protein